MAIRDEKPISVFNLPEQTRGDYSFVLRDRDGETVSFATLTTATLTLYLTDGVTTPFVFVNGRQNQNILNANNVTITADGRVTWDIQSADMAIFNTTNFFEPRVGLFKFVWPAGVVLHEVIFNVRNVPNA
jgi:hypothetical protein